MYKGFIKFVKDEFGKDPVPLHQPRFIGKEKEYVIDAIDSTFVSSVGGYVDEVERAIASLSNSAHGVATVNGTAALQVVLKAVGVERGDEVITQALTFVATANAIVYLGAEPVFVDVDRDTMGLSPTALEIYLNAYAEIREGQAYNKRTNRRIAACVPMHTFGFMVHMDRLMEVCRQWSIPVVEDAAEAFGSAYRGQPAGSIGFSGILSFNGNKVITCGGGGMILTSDRNLARRLKHLTTTAKVDHGWEYFHDELGYNFRMPNLNAAFLLAQIEVMDVLIESKRRLFEKYKAFFEVEGIELKLPPDNTDWNHWLMAVEVEDRESRDAFLAQTNESGVMCRPIWKLMFELPMYDQCQRDDQHNAIYLADRIVNIPSNWCK